MGKTAILAIKIIGDASSAVVAMEKVDGSASAMSRSMDRASAGSAIALGGLAYAADRVGDAASEAQQAAGGVDAVFKGYASNIHDYAKTADQAVGLSTAAYENMATVIGSQLKNMGLSLEESGGKTQSLISLGSDLAAQYGGTTSDAVSALSSLLRGERDPIERYGVSMNQAAIDAEKAALGLTGLSGEADKNADLQATLSILTRQTADAQGTFARESETAAGQQQRTAAAWENAAATLGEQLLPLMSEGAKIAGDLAHWVGENSEVVTVLAVGIGSLAAAILIINGAMKVFAAVQAVQTAAQWASNAAWLASPVTWIVLAIIAVILLLIAAGVYLVQHWGEVQRFGGEVWANISRGIESFGARSRAVVDGAVSWWTGLIDRWQRGFDTIVKGARDVLTWLGKLGSGVVPKWVTDLTGFKLSASSVDTAQPTMMRAASASVEATEAPSYARAMSVSVASLAAAPDNGSTAHGGSGENVTRVEVNFNGLVTDPEATARQIRKVLTDSDKLNGRQVAVVAG